ncbi:hypothetical protein SAY86_026297 [Trapa natans]|uniref:nicotinate phosphoribosyltransferase n=1 Tax=Trapa natans TaxID=22666 RepID=A0AAN7KFK3_TRANT|nr:hypothetical protein SAY86_026297 [Trapa natans]
MIYKAAGIRLNSGDLAYFSYEAGREEVTISDVLGYGQKRSYRLYGKEGYPLVDIITGENEPSHKEELYLSGECVKVGERILCRHPFSESKRAYVVQERVEELLQCYGPGA